MPIGVNLIASLAVVEALLGFPQGNRSYCIQNLRLDVRRSTFG